MKSSKKEYIRTEMRYAREAARKILKTSAVFGFSHFHHHGAGILFTFSVRGRDGKYLAKSYKERALVKKEAKNLWNISSTSIQVPRYYGENGKYLIEEFVHGTLFRDIIESLSRAESRKRYCAAIEELAKIHTARKEIKDDALLDNKRFGAPFFRKRLVFFQKVIMSDGFSSYEKYVGSVPRMWRYAVEKLPIRRLCKDLSTTEKNYVVGHGDYKPNNIIFTKKDRCPYIIDWLGMSKAQPWYDLAYLLVHENDKNKEWFVDWYLECMRERGFFHRVTTRMARALFLSGRIYQEFQRAKSNAHRICSSRDIHYSNEFRLALTGLLDLTSHY